MCGELEPYGGWAREMGSEEMAAEHLGPALQCLRGAGGREGSGVVYGVTVAGQGGAALS